MSASLVGSEMCIRDRSDSGKHRKALESTAKREKLLACNAFPSRSFSLWSCLLYTSDAADDM
eukprot:10621232-Alexandrium_andersonii.AAC.1